MTILTECRSRPLPAPATKNTNKTPVIQTDAGVLFRPYVVMLSKINGFMPQVQIVIAAPRNQSQAVYHASALSSA